MSSLFDRIGGETAVDTAVEKFYGKMLADDRLKDFFSETDMVKQKNHMKRFLTFAFGGPNKYSGRTMRAAHKKLVHERGLNESHFEATKANLVATLTDLGVPEADIAMVVTIVDSTRADILDLPEEEHTA